MRGAEPAHLSITQKDEVEMKTDFRLCVYVCTSIFVDHFEFYTLREDILKSVDVLAGPNLGCFRVNSCF